MHNICRIRSGNSKKLIQSGPESRVVKAKHVEFYQMYANFRAIFSMIRKQKYQKLLTKTQTERNKSWKINLSYL